MTEWLKSPSGNGIARFSGSGLGRIEVTKARTAGWSDPLVERHDVMNQSQAQLQWHGLRREGWTVTSPQW